MGWSELLCPASLCAQSLFEFMLRGELVGVREVGGFGGRENLDVRGEESHERYCADGAHEQLPQ